jgi:AhpD family alkylhydroperoxidase
MQPRMKNPAVIIGDAMKPMQAQWAAVAAVLPAKLLHLVHLRTSQVNGCSFCVDAAWKHGTKDGDTPERLFAVTAWRHSPLFTDPERAALALAESLTRIADAMDPVPDAIWADAAKHYDEHQLAALVLAIGTVNVWNRCNVATRQLPGQW